MYTFKEKEVSICEGMRELGEITYSLGIWEDIQLIYKFMRYGFSHLSTIKSSYKEMLNVMINTESVFHSYQDNVLKNKSVMCIVPFNINF